MTRILESLPKFVNALDNHRPIKCNKKGEWKVLGLSAPFDAKIKNKKKVDPNLRTFQSILAEVETYNLYFNASKEVMQKQAQFYENIIKTGRKIIQLHEKSQLDGDRDLCSSLDLAITKLQYRIQIENGGFETLKPEDVNANMVEKLQRELDLEAWQNEDEKFEHTNRQKQDYYPQLREICRYPEIVKYLLNPKNKKQTHEYLQRSLRDNFSVEVLNQYHNESKLLVDNFIASRLGAISRKLISVDLTPTHDGSFKKTLNLLMENNKVNLLDKQRKVRFSNGLEWTISRIYKDFFEKNDKPGKLEMMWDGVIPFNGHEISAPIISRKCLFKKVEKYAPPDFTKPDWFEKTSKLDERSKEYIETHYNIKVQPGQWVVVMEATRRNELDVEKAHGYSLFYQPIGENKYRVYSFGAFPFTFPQNTLEKIDFIAKTVPATIGFDPNYFYSQSQKAAWPLALNEAVARALLEELGRCKAAGIIFQFGWENCAFFIRNVFIKVFEKMNVGIEVPQFFEGSFLEVRPVGPLEVIQKLFKKVSKNFMPVLKLILALFFGAFRSAYVMQDGKRVKKNLWNSPFFKDKDIKIIDKDDIRINVPSLFHYQVKNERNLLKKAKNPDYKEKFAACVLNYGHRCVSPTETQKIAFPTSAITV